MATRLLLLLARARIRLVYVAPINCLPMISLTSFCSYAPRPSAHEPEQNKWSLYPTRWPWTRQLQFLATTRIDKHKNRFIFDV